MNSEDGYFVERPSGLVIPTPEGFAEVEVQGGIVFCQRCSERLAQMPGLLSGHGSLEAIAETARLLNAVACLPCSERLKRLMRELEIPL